MKLVSYNIQYGFGGDGRYDLSRAARIVAGAICNSLRNGIVQCADVLLCDGSKVVFKRILPGGALRPFLKMTEQSVRTRI